MVQRGKRFMIAFDFLFVYFFDYEAQDLRTLMGFIPSILEGKIYGID